MPGFLTRDQIQKAVSSPRDQFNAIFVRLMTTHHIGAVKMADQQLRSHGDLRLRIMAHAIRQQGEITLMQGVAGLQAVSQAIGNMAFAALSPSRQTP